MVVMMREEMTTPCTIQFPTHTSFAAALKKACTRANANALIDNGSSSRGCTARVARRETAMLTVVLGRG